MTRKRRYVKGVEKKDQLKSSQWERTLLEELSAFIAKQKRRRRDKTSIRLGGLTAIGFMKMYRI